MVYDVRLSRQARSDIQALSDYLMRYSDEAARMHVKELARAIERNIAVRPFTWPFFFLTGAPCRAYLFKLSRRATYWVVYEVNEADKAIEVLRIWHSAQNPEEFELD